MATPEGRSNERHRRMLLSAGGSGVAKGINILTALVSVPLTYNYLGAERYGLWMTMSTTIAMFSFADLGIGNGLLNRVSEAYGKNDREMARRHVSSAFFMLLGVALVFGAFFNALYPSLNWVRLFNIESSEAAVEVGPAMAVLVACFLANLPLGVIGRVRMGYQETFLNSLWLMAGNLAGLGGILLVIYFKGGLPWLVLAFAGAPVLGTMLNGFFLFVRSRQWLLPKWGQVERGSVRILFGAGMLFFVLQVCSALAYTSDNLIVAHVLGQEAVAEYAIVVRLFSVVPMVMEMFLTPLWPAYAEAMARRDVAWMKQTLVRSLILAVCFAACAGLFLAFAGRPIIHLWVNEAVTPPGWLLAGFGVWIVLSVAGSVVAAFLNGAGQIRFQAACAVVMSCVAIGLKIIFADRIGLPGIIWGMIAAYGLFTALPMAVHLPRMLRQFEREQLVYRNEAPMR